MIGEYKQPAFLDMFVVRKGEKIDLHALEWYDEREARLKSGGHA
jgi:hypothetical protein